MKTLAVIGANGFVGSAFVRQGKAAGFEVASITRENYASFVGQSFDVVVDAAANSKKYLADVDPKEDFRLSVEHRLKTLLDFRAETHLHVSSVDVYDDLTSPETTREERVIDVSRTSRYGFHKLLAEEMVKHYAGDWLIVRLAGMVGPGLRKNPVFDILSGLPLRIHPDSQYQFMSTDRAARISLSLLDLTGRRCVFNVCGTGLLSPRTISLVADRPMDLTQLTDTAMPRIVEASVARLEGLGFISDTRQTVETFVRMSIR